MATYSVSPEKPSHFEPFHFMRILILAHPLFLISESMPRFARMLKEGITEAGHEATIIRPKPYFYTLFGRTRAAKWASYLDQFVLFPFIVIAWDLRSPKDTLFVFADQALGPWVPYVRRHRKIIHCLDLLALKSALGLVPENPTSFTGRLYQKYIRWGFQHCSNFISISARTAADLEKYGAVRAVISEVVHLGLNYGYRRLASDSVNKSLLKIGLDVSCDGYLLYVGGGQWYKNRRGLLRIYGKYAASTTNPLPLICVSPNPGEELLAAIEKLPKQARVVFVQGINNETLEALYSGARVMLFPSLAEGFGWPIIEAQACGCPVITTDDSPMNEIVGPNEKMIPRLESEMSIDLWANHGAAVLLDILSMPMDRRLIELRIMQEWAENFRPKSDIPHYIKIYQSTLNLQ